MTNHRCLISRASFRTASLYNCKSLKQSYREIVPKLSEFHHQKGECGRICIVGGNKMNTGSPYFASMSALRVGADSAIVMCDSDAGHGLNASCPDVIIAPVLPDWNDHNDEDIGSIHSMVVGPGLGKDKKTRNVIHEFILPKGFEKNIPVVVDGEGIGIIAENPKSLDGYDRVIITPNRSEMSKLWKKFFKEDKDTFIESDVLKLSNALYGVTIVLKGHCDLIANAKVDTVLTCQHDIVTLKSCRGNGDILAGALGLFSHWATRSPYTTEDLLKGCMVACNIVKMASLEAYVDQGRGTVASDILQRLTSTMSFLETIE